MRTRCPAALILLCLLIIAACSRAAPTRQELPASKVQPGGDITTVVIGLHPWEDRPVINELISAFQAEHPAIRIEKRLLTEDGLGADGLLRNKQVDIISAPEIRSLSKVRLLQPLNPYIERSKLDWSAIGRMDELQTDGQIYDLPYYLAPYLLLYNEALCQAAGAGSPTKDWTWDDLRLAARKVAHGSGQNRVWGYVPNLVAPYWEFELYVLGQTPDLRWWANGPAIKRGMAFFGGMAQSDESAPRVPVEQPGPDWDPLQDIPQQEISPNRSNAALRIIELHSLSQLNLIEQSAGQQLGLAPTPLTPGQPPIVGVHPYTLAMAAGSPVQEAAWSFLEFVAGPKGAGIAAQLGYMPAYRTPELMEQWLQHKTAHMTGLEDLITRSVRFIKNDDPTSTPQQWFAARDAARAAFSGKLTPDEAYVRYVDTLPKPK